jgi:hypothetical protein
VTLSAAHDDAEVGRLVDALVALPLHVSVGAIAR